MAAPAHPAGPTSQSLPVVANIVAIGSGKGGVGKTTLSATRPSRSPDSAESITGNVVEYPSAVDAEGFEKFPEPTVRGFFR